MLDFTAKLWQIRAIYAPYFGPINPRCRNGPSLLHLPLRGIWVFALLCLVLSEDVNATTP